MSVCLNDKCKCITRGPLQFGVSVELKLKCAKQFEIKNKERIMLILQAPILLIKLVVIYTG